MLRLIKFMLPTCADCRALEPVIEDVLKDNPEVLYSEFNALEDDEAVGYDIRSVPTIIVQKDGEEVGRIDHMTDESSIRKLLASAG